MLRLIEYLIFGHVHTWEDVGTSRYKSDKGLTTSSGPVVYCRCTKCGAHKMFKDAAMKPKEPDQ